MEQQKAHEITLVKSNNNAFERIQIRSSKDAANFARQFYFSDIGIYESMFIILLDRSNTTIAWAKISQGGVAGTMVDVKLIAKYAIDSLASAVIMIHNHPSGNVSISSEDINASKRVEAGLSTLDVALIDSIVLTEDDFSSMEDENLL